MIIAHNPSSSCSDQNIYHAANALTSIFVTNDGEETIPWIYQY